jgi:hypothetical protein
MDRCSKEREKHKELTEGQSLKEPAQTSSHESGVTDSKPLVSFALPFLLAINLDSLQ